MVAATGAGPVKGRVRYLRESFLLIEPVTVMPWLKKLIEFAISAC